MEKATFAGGCFWCTEAVFQRLRGVKAVHPGYTGGSLKNPTYREVCGGDTGHAEAVEVEFDPDEISYEDLLDVFFHLHDPTTLNRQGADSGTQYRSAVFYDNDAQKEAAEKARDKLDLAHDYPDPVVTEISPAVEFYPAEDYHEDFYNRNPDYGYCRVVIDPKIQKLYKSFSAQLAR
jgi:peptide-methionine (S)-S-oxide reductase